MAEDAVETSLRALATFLVGGSTVEQTLQRIIDLAATAVPPAAYTGLTMLVEDKVTTAVFSDPDAPEIDQAQYKSGKGPCLDAFRHRRSYTIPSTWSDIQWPEFSRAASLNGIGSTMSLPLAASDQPLGALNFYAAAENAFSDGDEQTGEAFATQAAVVLANAQAYWDARALGEQLTRTVQ